MKSVAVVILNWNGREFLERFLGKVVERSGVEGFETQVVVADNGSDDDSADFVARNFPAVQLIALDDNYGFTGGYNRALAAVAADYYVLLNSDIEVASGWLAPLVELMEGDPAIAAVQPKVKSFADREYFEYAGASGGFIDMLGYPFCRGRMIGAGEKDTGQYDDTREIFWATGAAMAVRADLYHSTGGLDDRFFAHMEEIDLCWRMKRRGYRIMAAPASVVYHIGGGTLPAWSPHKTYLNFRNNIAMLYKNLPAWRFALVLAVRIATDFARILTYLVRLKFRFVAAIFRGHRDFWRMRRKLERNPEWGFGPVGRIYRGSIVLRWLSGGKRFGHLM